MATPLPPSRIVSWRSLARAMWLHIRLADLGARLKWLPASHERTCRAACRFLVYSSELHALMGQPEPETVTAMREVFERPFSDGSTLCERYGLKP